jgi:hypothetical protein
MEPFSPLNHKNKKNQKQATELYLLRKVEILSQ